MQQPNPHMLAQSADRALQGLKSLEANLVVFKNDLAQFYMAIGEPGIAEFILSPVAPQMGQIGDAGQPEVPNPWRNQQPVPQQQGPSSQPPVQQTPPFFHPYLEQGPLMQGSITGRPTMHGGPPPGGQQNSQQGQGQQGQQQGRRQGGGQAQVQHGQVRPY